MTIDYKYPKDLDFRLVKHFHDNIGGKLKTSIPHEWSFIDLFYKNELKKDPTIAQQFAMYVLANRKYQWSAFDQNLIEKIINGAIDKDLINYIDKKLFEMVFIESDLNSFTFKSYYKIQEQNRKILLPKDESYYKSMEYGDIVTEFMIRTLGYSLIGNSKQKVIITSMSDCSKRFENYLEQGFSLQRLSKAIYIKHTFEQRIENPLITGHFKYLPVLPTNSPYNIDEIIETKNKTYMKIIQ